MCWQLQQWLVPSAPECKPAAEGKAHQLKELGQQRQPVDLVQQAVGEVQHQQAATTPGQGLVPAVTAVEAVSADEWNARIAEPALCRTLQRPSARRWVGVLRRIASKSASASCLRTSFRAPSRPTWPSDSHNHGAVTRQGRRKCLHSKAWWHGRRVGVCARTDRGRGLVAGSTTCVVGRVLPPPLGFLVICVADNHPAQRCQACGSLAADSPYATGACALLQQHHDGDCLFVCVLSGCSCCLCVGETFLRPPSSFGDS